MILILIVLFCVLFFNRTEYFDDIHTNRTLPSCADLCKTVAGCYGFGHKDDTCYISSSVINNYPHHSIYKDVDIGDYVVCNKVHTVILPDNNLSEFERKGNSTYVCRPREHDIQDKFDEKKHQKLMFSNNKKFTIMDEGQNLSFLTSVRTPKDLKDFLVSDSRSKDQVEDYEVGPYAWPQSLYEAEQRRALNQYIK